MSSTDQSSRQLDRRVALLLPAGALLLFLGYCVAVDLLGWLDFDLGPIAGIFGALAVFNFGLALTARRWTFGRWGTFGYETLHAVLLTVALHHLGGTRMG